MKMVPTVKMSELALRDLCIEQGWYTKESDKERDQQLHLQTEQFNKLFNNIVKSYGSDESVSTDRLMVVADDILRHSDIEIPDIIEYDNQLNYIARMVCYKCIKHTLEPVY